MVINNDSDNEDIIPKENEKEKAKKMNSGELDTLRNQLNLRKRRGRRKTYEKTDCTIPCWNDGLVPGCGLCRREG